MAKMKMASQHGSSEKEGKAWGHGQHANMPTEVQMKAYPKATEYGPGVIDDTMVRIDTENKQARNKSRSNVSNQH